MTAPGYRLVTDARLEELICRGTPSSDETHDMAVELLVSRRAAAAEKARADRMKEQLNEAMMFQSETQRNANWQCERYIAARARADKAEKALWDAEISLDPEHETKWYAAYKDLLAEIRNRAALKGE
ncbi:MULTISPECIES: hypothetical protein [unclassified Chelatococcus]|uniref:hypothetical protein n=1 Tax=unclassified Chelatococcus TaxID=2638111 RepID=UPI001BCD6024|nr:MULTISPECIES: hypothetical protein [unclassified Chelatococcus]MBS7697829.1 hypothetical protein [Chelatococcus sp. YT9]MBS7698561.1 hypothetical protein [Chelatococcus sp. YT9]MBX3559816.1 hypothetical protein [Chelatococcus sp.]